MSLKSLREALCTQQTAPRSDNWPEDVRASVSGLINLIDHHRPLGPDGSHGDLHTPTCGCETEPSITRLIIDILEDVDAILHGRDPK